MKSISCTIWILSALLVITTLDATPDPPAVKPNAARHSVLPPHDYSCDAPLLPGCDSSGLTDPSLVGLAAVDAGEPSCPGSRIVLAGRAAHSSPPPLQA
jgi:hypothetical protein